MEILSLSVIIAVAVTLLVTQWIRIELTALVIIVALPATRLLTPAEALSGFASEATITVAAMLILSAGLVRTGALDYVAGIVSRLNISGPRGFLLMVGLMTAIPSAFLNNTAIVIMVIPVVLRLCQEYNYMPSKVMIPLSYFAILGGTVTLVGTSTNILVHTLDKDAGGPGFSMFEFAPMGVCYLVLGGTFLLLFSNRMLPKRKVLSQLLEPQHRSNFVTEIVVPESSKLAGNPLSDLLGGVEKVRVLELVRGEEVHLGPPHEMTIEPGDMLLIEGSPNEIGTLLEKQRLDLASAVADEQRVKISRIDLFMAEAVVTPNSPFQNQRLSEVGLNRHYGIKVLAIQRMGRHLQVRLREMALQEGDVMLIQGEEDQLRELQNSGSVLLIEGVDQTIRFSKKAPLAAGILVSVVALATVGRLPISVVALGGAAMMLLTRCLRFRGATRALDSSVLLLIAGALPLGIAMEKTGMAELMARTVLGFAQDFGPAALIGALYLVTSILTAFLSNTATAVLLAPIVLKIASETGFDPKPLLVAVTFGASASFFTPIGYQTNLLVMGPGGYLFRDYLKIGLTLNLILWIAATILIPLFWPLQ
jgi:di/tricarboxylate transporter